jgi:hypothetical protein
MADGRSRPNWSRLITISSRGHSIIRHRCWFMPPRRAGRRACYHLAIAVHLVNVVLVLAL